MRSRDSLAIVEAKERWERRVMGQFSSSSSFEEPYASVAENLEAKKEEE